MAGVAGADAGPDAEVSLAPGADAGEIADHPEEVKALARQVERVRALLAEKLDVTVEPQSLFDVPLADENAIAVEIVRLERVLGVPPERAELDAGADAAPGATAVPSDDSILLQSRLALDAARLDFYRKPQADREALLKRHTERQKTERVDTPEEELRESGKKALAAEESRQRALEVARLARTEAARTVAEEEARLLSVEKQQAEFEGELVRRRQALDAAAETTLTWQRRIREAIEAAAPQKSGGESVDALYDELRKTLKGSRDELDRALTALSSSHTDVPSVGGNPLSELPAEVNVEVATKKRADLEKAERTLAGEERAAQQGRAAAFSAQIEKLNRGRLQLLPLVSAGKRDALTGLGAAGRDQGAAEARQVALTFRARLRNAIIYLRGLGTSSPARTDSVLGVGAVALSWGFVLAVYVWWRRRAEGFLVPLLDRLREARRSRALVGPSFAERSVEFLIRIRARLEIAVVLYVLYRFLPPEILGLLEIRIPVAIVGWTVGGALAVDVADALAGEGSGRLVRVTQMQTRHIRIASLRLISRAVVVFGAILSVTDVVVGKGTIYTWVFSAGWFAALPVALVIVHWWKPIIFEIVATKRKKRPFDRWVDARKAGWVSFPVAALAGVFLLGTGVGRRIRAWTTGLELTRRLLAYLFQREMSKKVVGDGREPRASLSDELLRALDPETPSMSLVTSAADEEANELLEQIDRRGGGVFAVVGERGLGKTTLLHRMQGQRKTVTLVTCPPGGLTELQPAIARALGLRAEATFDEIGEKLDQGGDDAALLLDDAHRLIRPTMGGLDAMDRLLEVARKYSSRSAWVFAIDDVVWRFFELARGARPAFDEALVLRRWQEEAIVRLIRLRCKEAGVTPDFSVVIDDLPADADAFDREEARQRAEIAYSRMMWDYAEGNPGLAIHAWRSCLSLAEDGAARVEPFEPADIAELERLPDASLFVLRALVRLEDSSAREVSDATMIPLAKVQDTLRYGQARGFVEFGDDNYSVPWPWYRAVTRFLRRRYLLHPTRPGAA